MSSSFNEPFRWYFLSSRPQPEASAGLNNLLFHWTGELEQGTLLFRALVSPTENKRADRTSPLGLYGFTETMYLTFLVHGKYLVFGVITGIYFVLTCAMHYSLSFFAFVIFLSFLRVQICSPGFKIYFMWFLLRKTLALHLHLGYLPSASI